MPDRAPSLSHRIDELETRIHLNDRRLVLHATRLRRKLGKGIRVAALITVGAAAAGWWFSPNRPPLRSLFRRIRVKEMMERAVPVAVPLALKSFGGDNPRVQRVLNLVTSIGLPLMFTPRQPAARQRPSS